MMQLRVCDLEVGESTYIPEEAIFVRASGVVSVHLLCDAVRCTDGGYRVTRTADNYVLRIYGSIPHWRIADRVPTSTIDVVLELAAQ